MLGELSIPSLVTALVTGGAAWEGFKFLYPELKQRIGRSRDAQKLLRENIDPILKASDELYGKLYSLSNEDFLPITSFSRNQNTDKIHMLHYVCYLFAQFWAQMEFIRLQSKYSSVSGIKKGEELLRFISTCETRKFRILDRSVQRIIGEAMIEGSNGAFRIMSLNKFILSCENPQSELFRWIQMLQFELLRTYKKENRQKFLRYGIIVASLIEHFDPAHKIVLRRKIYVNKLSNTSKKILSEELFRLYLPFIDDKKKYFS